MKDPCERLSIQFSVLNFPNFKLKNGIHMIEFYEKNIGTFCVPINLRLRKDIAFVDIDLLRYYNTL